MGKEVATYDERLAALAKKQSQAEDTPGAAHLSTKGKRFSVDDVDLGTDIIVVVLDAVRENAYYKQKYDPRAKSYLPPNCFALGRDKDMVPHDVVFDSEEGDHFDPQAESCDECPMNVFGSSDTGRGKACGNRRRLAVMLVGEVEPATKKSGEEVAIYDDPADYEESDIAILRLPPTALKAWSRYVRSLASAYNRPTCGVITRISISPADGEGVAFHFSVVEELPHDLLDVVFDRVDAAGDILTEPYAAPTDEQLAEAAPKGRGRTAIAGLRKGRR